LCHACEVACKQENNLPKDVALIRILANKIKAEDGRHKIVYDWQICRQCEKPPCAESCPVKAISSNEYGVVLIDEDKCIGCLLCLDACPFGAMAVHSAKGIPVKCSLCYNRLKIGMLPACTNVCVARAIKISYAGDVPKIERTQPKEQKRGERIIRSVCLMCHGGCGILVHTQNGKAIRIEGDPESPLSKGSLCAKGLSAIQLLYHPERLRYPARRAGRRGEGNWRRISWEEATDIIANKMNEIKEHYGVEQVAFMSGTGRQVAFYTTRTGFAFGTPNARISNPHICFLPRMKIGSMLYGRSIQYDMENSKCILFVGGNFLLTNSDQNLGARLLRGLSNGAKLISVDPVLSSTANKANLWLQIRPGTDSAFFLALLNVIINEELYDKAFINRWTIGFGYLRNHVKPFTPKWAENITGIPAEDIRKAAFIYATTKPACIVLGVAIEMNTNTTNTVQAAWLLPILTGNVDIKGGNFFWESPLGNRFDELVGEHMLTDDQHARSVASPRIQFYQPPGYDAWHAILSGNPYPIRALMVHGANPMLGHENTKLVYDALSKVDFLSVMDHFMTPTASMADIVLPAATFLEVDDVIARFAGNTHGTVFCCQKAVEPVYESKDDKQFFIRLAQRAGFDFGFSSIYEMFDWMLEPVGLTFTDFKERGFITQPQRERKYEIGALRADGKPGFSTFDGKLSFYSHALEELGLEPMPVYREPKESPISKSDVAKEYPLILTSGRRLPIYFHSQYRQIPWLRELAPEPIAEMHPETAALYGLNHGEWVYLESPRGRCKQQLRLCEGVMRGVVQAEHDWWFPEREDDKYGVWQSNINLLIDSEEPYDLGCGSTPMRGLLCKVYKIQD
jgi:anaerobic selenocysteine-containing dehydrogenase/NAD-dependent dihydropyrimidine dehydrogenase PreA subunit